MGVLCYACSCAPAVRSPTLDKTLLQGEKSAEASPRDRSGSVRATLALRSSGEYTEQVQKQRCRTKG